MQKSGQQGSPRKVFLLALDSTPLSLLQENISVLPNIAALLRNGRTIQTESPADLVSGGPWQTFASGLMPGEQGHYFPMQWDPSAMRFIPIKEDGLPFEPFWDTLEREGVKTVVFDAMAVPLNTDAPGVQLINWNTQCNFAASSNRPELLKYIKRKFGNKPIGPEIAVKKSRRALAKVRDQLIKSAKLKTDAMLWFMQEFDWTCFVTGIFEGHRAAHSLWPIWEDFSSDPPEGAMLDVYREIDTQIGRVLSALDLSETTFILFSMHGMTAGRAQDHFLPELMPRINQLYLKKIGQEAPPRPAGGLARFLRQTVPPVAQMQIRELVGQTVQDWIIDREWRGGKDWTITPGFAVPGGGDVGFVRLNLQGRERDGFLLEGDDASDYVDFLCKQLKALRVKQTNEPLIDDIVLSRDAFPGSYNYLLPDVFLTWRPDSPATEICSPELGTIKATLKTGRGGTHTGDSFAIIFRSGPRRVTASVARARLQTLLATVLGSGVTLRRWRLDPLPLQPPFGEPNRSPQESGYQTDEPVEKRQGERIARRHAGKAESLDKDDFPDAPSRERNRHHGEQQCSRDKRERIEGGNRDAERRRQNQDDDNATEVVGDAPQRHFEGGDGIAEERVIEVLRKLVEVSHQARGSQGAPDKLHRGKSRQGSAA